MGTFHSTATLSIQGVPVVCMGSGSCTVSIFPCPALATLAGQASFFSNFIRPNPNPNVMDLYVCYEQPGLDCSDTAHRMHIHHECSTEIVL